MIAYQYYAFKFADAHSGVAWTLGVRRIELQTQNSTGHWQAWIDGATGNMYLRGTMLDGQTITPPADSFIIQNATGHNVSYIDSSGNLRLSGTFVAGGTP